MTAGENMLLPKDKLPPMQNDVWRTTLWDELLKRSEPPLTWDELAPRDKLSTWEELLMWDELVLRDKLSSKRSELTEMTQDKLLKIKLHGC